MENTKIINFPNLKIVDEDFEVDFQIEMEPIITEYTVEATDLREEYIKQELDEVNNSLAANNKRIDELNKEIDRLTNKADGLDYMVAVGSGIIAGIVDSLWVGEFDFNRGHEWSNKKINDFVMKVAKKQGFDPSDYDGEDPLKGAIKYLEENYPIPSDGIWNSGHYGMNGKSHRLDDWAHHPSLLGLFFSILTQFTYKGYFTNKYGENIAISVVNNEKAVMLIGNDIPSKLFCGVVNWFFHLISDMAGSSENPGAGMGIPGPIMTLLKEFSALPLINKTNLPKILGEFFEKYNFDLRKELAVGHELGRQAVPVILNEVIVRAFYFIRRLTIEIKEKREFNKIEWEKTLPFKNRTIARMLTIATGTFTLIDLGDAAIRAGLKSGPNSAAFVKNFILRVNFVGIGRFAIAVATDVGMGVERNKLRNERLAVFSEQLHLMNVKVYYLQAESWIAAETTEKTINEALAMMEKAILISKEAWKANMQAIYNIAGYREDIEEHNPGLIDSITGILS